MIEWLYSTHDGCYKSEGCVRKQQDAVDLRSIAFVMGFEILSLLADISDGL